MATTLTYGLATTCLLDSEEVLQLQPRQPRPLPVDRIAAAVKAQLKQPLNYPSLSQATIPGDRIVLAVEPGIPQQLPVIDAALTALRDAGAEADLITILLSSPQADSATLQAELTALGHTQCHVKIHNPDNERERAFLGVTQAGRALRLNRQLCDADFVLPITVATVEAQRYFGAGSGSLGPAVAAWFPGFSDRETIVRFSAVAAEDDEQATSELRRELEDCGRLLGVGMILQVVPCPGGRIAAILAGEPTQVCNQAREHYRHTWGCDTEVRGDLVIATLAGDADQQTWQNIGRALAAASAVLEVGGAIAICSELAEPPGRALSQLMGNQDPLVVERAIVRNPSADSGPALQLCRALQRGSVYLRSQLRSSVVESLGLTPLESDSELERLAQGLRPCLVLEEAQRLLPVVVAADS